MEYSGSRVPSLACDKPCASPIFGELPFVRAIGLIELSNTYIHWDLQSPKHAANSLMWLILQIIALCLSQGNESSCNP